MPAAMPAESPLPQVFDRGALRRHRERAARRLFGYDFLFREVAERLADRLLDVNRRFPLALDLGSRTGILAEVLQGRGGIETLVQSELSPTMAALARGKGNPTVVADAETLPFGPARFDLILSCLELHWVNDLPGVLAQIRYALKPDGLFLAAIFGGGTLAELRQALLEGEAAAAGGASPRVSPFVEVRDAGMLLQRAGFALPVVDADRIPVDYADPLRLMRDLSRMGEGNALQLRPRGFTRSATLIEAAERYPRRPDGRIEATFEVVYLTAWTPHESQQRPLRPGSAGRRLAEALEAEERPAGEKPGG